MLIACQAFKPGNIDLPAHSHIANPGALTLPDAITDIDLLAPMPDPSLLLSQSLDLGGLGLADLTVPDWDSSQFLSTSVEQPRAETRGAGATLLEDDSDLELDIDIGDDIDIPAEGETSFEMGRNAPLEARASAEPAMSLKDFGEEDNLNLDIGDDMTELSPGPEIEIDTDIPMGGMTELEAPEEPTIAAEPASEAARERSMSPLSELGEDEQRALEEEVQDTSIFQPAVEEERDEEEIQQARAKRRRVIQQDTQTQLSASEIRAQQNNRDDILKPASFLPRDPLLMALINMQKSGGFVSSILGDGRSQGWEIGRAHV